MSGPLSAGDPGLRLVITTMKAHMKEMKLTCADMARAVGVHHSVMSRALNGERGLSVSSFRKLYVAFGWMHPILEIGVFMPDKAEAMLNAVT